MASYMKCYLRILLITIFCISYTSTIAFSSEISDAIKGIVPENWKIIQIKKNEIPWGHYWGIDYDGPKGYLLVLEGPADVLFNWQDRSGNWHKDPIAKEALELWVMPSGYKRSWKRFFVLHRPIAAKHIFSSEYGEIYGKQGHLITSKEKTEEILSQAKSTAWPDSPHNGKQLSWSTWEKDLKQGLKK
jgi:hypothetical protein